MAAKRNPTNAGKGAAAPSPRPGAPHKLLRLSLRKQKRLESLMRRNNQGRLSNLERETLQGLVRETEQIALENARRLAARSGRGKRSDPEAPHSACND